MPRKLTIVLDQVLRDDQIARLQQRAVDDGLAEAARRSKKYDEGKQRPKRRSLLPVSSILEDLGMTLPAAARRLVREHKLEKSQAKKLPGRSVHAPRTSTKRSAARK
jgi:hypothetical protein